MLLWHATRCLVSVPFPFLCWFSITPFLACEGPSTMTSSPWPPRKPCPLLSPPLPVHYAQPYCLTSTEQARSCLSALIFLFSASGFAMRLSNGQFFHVIQISFPLAPPQRPHWNSCSYLAWIFSCRTLLFSPKHWNSLDHWCCFLTYKLDNTFF